MCLSFLEYGQLILEAKISLFLNNVGQLMSDIASYHSAWPWVIVKEKAILFNVLTLLPLASQQILMDNG